MSTAKTRFFTFCALRSTQSAEDDGLLLAAIVWSLITLMPAAPLLQPPD